MIKRSFKLSSAMTIAALMFLGGSAAAQQAYPNKPIRFIVPFAPGGSTSVMARYVAQGMTERWGQQVLVDNRGGGNTVIGTRAVANAPPDGYTILLVTTSIVTVPSMMTPVPFDPVKDFAAVATLAIGEYALAISPLVPVNDLREFIAYAKARPGQLNFSSSGAGGPGHLAGELFNIVADVKLTHVPYKGANPAVTDLVGGRVESSFVMAVNVLGFVKTGKLKLLAISGKSRLDTLPQVPTFTEANLPSYGLNVWYGVLAPAGTPEEIVNSMSTEIASFLAKASTKDLLSNQGLDPFISTPAQFSALLKADYAKYTKVIRAANIRVED